MARRMLFGTLLVVALGSLAGTVAIAGYRGLGAGPATADVTFRMVRAAALEVSGCLPDVTANVGITRLGPAEQLTIHAHGLYPSSNYTVFLVQSSTAPFGLAVFLGELHADPTGSAAQTFVGRFSRDSFAVAPGSVSAPVLHPIDASENPAFAPVHLLHLGVWFKTAAREAAAGCGNVVTPFSGNHTGGIQVLNTSQFPALAGPLGMVH